MRMKHGSGRGPATSAKPRLLAAFTAVAMMFATAVPALMPKTAVAATYDPALATNGGTCSPMNIELGDTSQTAKEDTGVATWVGRDMYVGSRPSDTSKLSGWDAAPGGSYAAEAEGLTLVNGKLAMNPYKRSWSNNGFRFGTVGFGAQFRPALGSYTLAVSGQNSAITEMSLPSKSDTSSETVSTNVGAWARPAFVGATKDDKNWYKAKLSGPKSYTLDLYGDKKDYRRAAIVDFWTDNDKKNDNILWDQDSATLFDDVNGVNYNNYNKTGKNYTENIQDQSQWMYSMTETGKVTTRVVDSGSMYRKKYNAEEGGGKGPQYVFNFSSAHKEKVLVFTGDGTSHMQVFNLKASELNSVGYAGVSYDFRNFPDDASIVINVVNDEGEPYDGSIDYHNGWQFWWNPTNIQPTDTEKFKKTEISNGYWDHASADAKKAYSTASQSIMWNFGETNYLSIRGGTYNDQSDDGTGTQPIGTAIDELGDDPAAAMLGSIMVPHGSFDDHVTTNGRVRVGEDFMMNNPTSVATFKEGDSASIIDMDQERHNFAWYGSLSTTCSTIDWTKVGEDVNPDTSENVPLPGTTWAVYNTLDAAQANTTTPATKTGSEPNVTFTSGRLFTVTDNVTSSGDLNPIEGAFQLQKLLPEANYYIRETAAPSGYTVNPNIYHFQTKNSGTTTNTFVRVLDAQGNPIAKNEDKLITSDGFIINPLNGSSIEWGKTKKGEFVGLGGSEWVLTKTGTSQQQWLIKDDGAKIDSLTIYDGDKPAEETKNVTQGQPFRLTAQVVTEGTNREVDWTAAPDAGVVISKSDGGRSVEITAQKIPDTEDGSFVLTAIAADGTTQDSIVIYVNPVAVDHITITPTNPTIMKNGIVQLDAKVFGEGDAELSLIPEWASDNEDIATIDPTGKVTGVAEGSVTITATAGNEIATTTVTVLDGTRIYADTDWSDVKIYAWVKNADGSNRELLGKWDSRPSMKKDPVTGLWYRYLSGVTEPFYVIITSGTIKTGDIRIDASATKDNTFKLSNLLADNDSPEIVNPFNPYPQANSVSTQSNAPRKAKAARAGDTTPTWSHINTTEWEGTDKQLADKNPAIGKFKLDGLSAGTYYLQENKAPDGYFINPTVYTITIGENGSVTWSPEPDKDSNGLHWISDVPTEFSWDKVDAGYVEGVDGTVPKNPIEGSKWKLQKFQNGNYVDEGSEITDCVANAASGCTGTDKNYEAGKFKLTGLALGKYRLYESEAPEGYQTPTNVYYYFELSTKKPSDTTPVKWTKGTGEIDSTTGAPKNATKTASDTNSGRSVQNTEAPNYRLPGDVYWGKVSSETGSDGKHVYLGGSAWRVTYIPATGEGERVTVDITDCVSSGGSKTGTCDEAETGKPAWAFDSYPAAGRIGFRNLPWGTYELVETKAPDGYNVDSETVYTFTVDATHRENVRIYVKNSEGKPGDPIITPSNPTDQEGKPLPDYPNQVISNTPGFELPSTGGEGNTLIVLFGFALIAISMLGCAIAMRKRI